MKQLLHNTFIQTNEEMKMKHSYYEYEVTQDFEASYDLADRDPNISTTKWIYTIINDEMYGGDIDSDEWYHSEQEAIEAACNHIDRLEDGPDDPDYDAPTAEEMYQRAHEDRRKLRGY